MSEFCIHCHHEIGLRLYDKPPPGQEFMPPPFNKPVATTSDGRPLYDRTAFRYRSDRTKSYLRSRHRRDDDWDSDPGYSDLGIETFQG